MKNKNPCYVLPSEITNDPLAKVPTNKTSKRKYAGILDKLREIPSPQEKFETRNNKEYRRLQSRVLHVMNFKVEGKFRSKKKSFKIH